MSLNNSFEISSQGLSAQSSRMQIHANNIANTNTPYYTRKIPVLSENTNVAFSDVIQGMRGNVFQAGISFTPSGVNFDGVVQDPTPGQRVYSPGHPQADEDGYVTQSNVNVLSDMADALMSARLFEANLGVLSITRNMINRSLEIGRNQ
ncbi:MAG: flagellar basal body rod protein FlgC [Vampirovibrio sp.]|nr:flagellar basal body rod protein FlgC [Vampirovibrio sp.]